MNDTRAWTEDEDRELRKLWREGKQDPEIGVAIGRHKKAVAHRRWHFALPANKKYRHTPERLARIRKATIERHKDPAMRIRMHAGLGIGNGPKNMLPPRGTAERKAYEKIQLILGTPAARRALMEGRL